MRESIGGAWLLGIVLVFMSIFIAYIAITINYSNTYLVKTKMVTTVEQYQGLNPTTLEKLDWILKSEGYMKTLNCGTSDEKQILGVTNKIVTENPTTPQSYCITREVRYGENDSEAKYYYTVTVAFGFSLPLLGNLFDFKVGGETGAIYYPEDSYFR